MIKIPKMTTLSIAHNVFLTKSERYALHERSEVHTTGVSLPVWFHKGSTSEPAQEVFCKYIIRNVEGEAEYIKPILGEGYFINIPQIPEDYVHFELTDEEWRSMKPAERNRWYELHPSPKSSQDLLDIQDKGGAYLKFKKVGRMLFENNKINAVHFIILQDMGDLVETLTDNPLE